MPRNPDDDNKIVACAVVAGAEYIISRYHDLLSVGSYGGVTILTPEAFLRIVRQQP